MQFYVLHCHSKPCMLLLHALQFGTICTKIVTYYLREGDEVVCRIFLCQTRMLGVWDLVLANRQQQTTMHRNKVPRHFAYYT